MNVHPDVQCTFGRRIPVATCRRGARAREERPGDVHQRPSNV